MGMEKYILTNIIISENKISKNQKGKEKTTRKHVLAERKESDTILEGEFRAHSTGDFYWIWDVLGSWVPDTTGDQRPGRGVCSRQEPPSVVAREAEPGDKDVQF